MNRLITEIFKSRTGQVFIAKLLGPMLISLEQVEDNYIEYKVIDDKTNDN